MKINTVHDLIEHLEHARSVLEVTDEDRQNWLQNRVTRFFTAEIAQIYSERLLKLQTLSDDGIESQKTRGEIRLAEELLNKLTEINND